MTEVEALERTTKRLDETLSALEDSYIISPEKLKKLGDGDEERGRAHLRLLLADETDNTTHIGPTEKPANVRVATQDDEQAIFDLMKLQHEESGHLLATFSPERAWEHIHFCTRSNKGGLLGVIDGPEGKPVAVVGIVPYKWWFSEQYHLTEIFTFVHPDHRLDGNGSALIQFSKWVADEWSKGVDYRVYMLMGVQTVRRVASKIRLYRRFVTQVGAWFCYPTPGLEE